MMDLMAALDERNKEVTKLSRERAVLRAKVYGLEEEIRLLRMQWNLEHALTQNSN